MEFPAGTKTAGTPGAFTDQQYAALEGLKQPGLRLRAARAEFAGKLLLADGTVSDDVGAMMAAATEFDQVLAASRAAFIAQLREANPGVTAAALDRAVAVAGLNPVNKAAEAAAMLAEERFLLIVDGAGVPVIYYQCAVPGNPDIEAASTKEG
jgi:hypothetical protein